ncbi:hypothetical protein B0H14DRAFT_65989 [Mycena olivaceomarginata]|nr:hypothetical protein B0H14DRAFT_65989 [Mycena olivaceomarginata]
MFSMLSRRSICPSSLQTRPYYTILPLSSRSAFARRVTIIVNSLLESWEHQQLLMLPDRQGLSNSSTQQREKLRDVEKQAGTFLALVLDSREARRAARRLEGRDAQLFVDAVQDVLNRGTLQNAAYRSKARQLMQKVSEAVEHLPSFPFHQRCERSRRVSNIRWRVR